MTKENNSQKIQELQMIEHNLQHLLMQKQTTESELNEVNNAHSELGKSEEDPYKIISGVMLKVNKEGVLKELEEKKKMLELRINAIEKQQNLSEKKASEIREGLSEKPKKEDK
jgi:prefoldin beta subunit